MTFNATYEPSPPPTDPRIECRHHVAFVHCPICNPPHISNVMAGGADARGCSR